MRVLFVLLILLNKKKSDSVNVVLICHQYNTRLKPIKIA